MHECGSIIPHLERRRDGTLDFVAGLMYLGVKPQLLEPCDFFFCMVSFSANTKARNIAQVAQRCKAEAQGSGQCDIQGCWGNADNRQSLPAGGAVPVPRHLLCRLRITEPQWAFP